MHPSRIAEPPRHHWKWPNPISAPPLYNHQPGSEASGSQTGGQEEATSCVPKAEVLGQSPGTGIWTRKEHDTNWIPQNALRPPFEDGYPEPVSYLAWVPHSLLLREPMYPKSFPKHSKYMALLCPRPVPLRADEWPILTTQAMWRRPSPVARASLGPLSIEANYAILINERSTSTIEL